MASSLISSASKQSQLEALAGTSWVWSSVRRLVDSLMFTCHLRDDVGMWQEFWSWGASGRLRRRQQPPLLSNWSVSVITHFHKLGGDHKLKGDSKGSRSADQSGKGDKSLKGETTDIYGGMEGNI